MLREVKRLAGIHIARSSAGWKPSSTALQSLGLEYVRLSKMDKLGKDFWEGRILVDSRP